MIDPLAQLTFLPLQLSGNPINYNIEAADPVAIPERADLAYLLRIDVPEFPQSPTLVELTTLEGREKPPVTKGGATTYEGAFFRIDELLDGFLSRQKPFFRQTELSAIATLTMPYRPSECVKQADAQLSLTPKPTRWVIAAGLSDSDAAGWADRFFDVYQANTRQFLTWHPDNKQIGRDQEEYLYFVLNCSPLPTVVKLRVELTGKNGASVVVTVTQIRSVGAYQVICAPIGMPVMKQYEVDASNPIVSYRLWLANQNDECISQVRTYYVDNRYQASERHLLFANSLGGYDTLRLVGSSSQSLKVSRTIADRGAGTDLGELYVVDVAAERTITLQTGWLERNSRATLRYLDELLLSREWYLVTTKGHQPLQLATTELIDADDSADLISRSFTFTTALASYYSELPAPPTTQTRATAWRGVGFRHILDERGKRTGMGTVVRLRKYYLDDKTDVKPTTDKPNSPGDPDYMAPAPVPSVVIGSTPFPSAAIGRAGSYKRATCPSGQEGSTALISVAAGSYGGELEGDGDARAEAEFRRLDTQAYADTYGACSLSETYAWPVPAGQWHIRYSQPDTAAIYHNDGQNGPADMGNTQSLQGTSGAFIYPTKANDLNFPVSDLNWLVYVSGQPGAAKRVRLYKNGAQLYSRDITLNPDGYELLALFTVNGVNYPPASTDRFYFKHEDR
ncbi:DUF5977 domain-containing protein [Spirosoma oryzicola]|uniref:DUF5977 domain-containing protein n=1 Tax=Spirosoma oryzicola TaxID=2898794 RepID=UPI001E4359D2|nr:hypothetical protein [Spirosoma oryzicola]UHG93335.1 hypothetical protein LQ777_10625 [Spirosoma oryzicola]